MSAINSHRDLLVAYKKATLSNLSILSKIYPMDSKLARQIFKEEALQKPTQHIFIHLSYYLVTIIDVQKASKISWPVYDSKSEKTYREQFASIITEYCKQGAISLVMSAYLVNPGCPKVTKLMAELSHLAIEKALQPKMQDHHKTLYNTEAEKYRSRSSDHSEFISKETEHMKSKFDNYLLRRNAATRVSEMISKKIDELNEKLTSLKKEGFLSELVDEFLKKNQDEKSKCEIEKIKELNKPVPILDAWLEYFDEEMTNMELEWENRAIPFLEISKSCQMSAQSLISQHNGETDRKSYMVEYDPKSDKIDTKDLETQVNSQQRYILKNVIKENRLNFPNLVRGFVIAMCFILKNSNLGDIYKINEYLEAHKRNFNELVTSFKILIERVDSAKARLQKSSPNVGNISRSLMELSVIPPLPDLSDLKANWNTAQQVIFDSFTPLSSSSKHHFNFGHKSAIPIFVKPQPKPLATPFHHSRGNDILGSLISGRLRSTKQPKLNMSQNISIISKHSSQANETIVECSSGFTTQQINRLLSTKKASSSKKHKFNSKRPNINVKKGGLFHESTDSTLIRSQSSPNILESGEKRCCGRRLSIMQEDTLSPKVSGIGVLDLSKSAEKHGNDQPRKLLHAMSIPIVTISPVECLGKFNHILNETDSFCNDFCQERVLKPETLKKNTTETSDTLKDKVHLIRKTSPVEKIMTTSFRPVDCLETKFSQILETESIRVEFSQESVAEAEPLIQKCKETSSGTPTHNALPVKKTSSLEKIINRYKKVRASNLFTTEAKENSTIDFRTIYEHGENNLCPVNVDVLTANKNLLPDLLSPSCSLPSKSSATDLLDSLLSETDKEVSSKCRESLGTALGVDHTFLDQFDLID